VIDLQRRLNKFLDSPPGFGFRGTGSGWMDHLHSLKKTGGFKKSLTMRPALTKVRAIIASKRNPWRDRLRTWGLLEVPYGLAAKPSPARRAQLDRERKQRIDGELARLQKTYSTQDAAATLARYQQDYDAETKRLEDSAKAELPPLVESLPGPSTTACSTSSASSATSRRSSRRSIRWRARACSCRSSSTTRSRPTSWCISRRCPRC
jgi:hypothetical protein